MAKILKPPISQKPITQAGYFNQIWNQFFLKVGLESEKIQGNAIQHSMTLTSLQSAIANIKSQLIDNIIQHSMTLTSLQSTIVDVKNQLIDNIIPQSMTLTSFQSAIVEVKNLLIDNTIQQSMTLTGLQNIVSDINTQIADIFIKLLFIESAQHNYASKAFNIQNQVESLETKILFSDINSSSAVSGPASALDNEVPIFDGTSGKVIKAGSGLIISDNLIQAENKALLLEGTTGETPTSGAGARMMYIPSKGAFRVGKVSGDQWDDANIGDFSFACGLNTKASKISFASGLGDAGGILEASGDASFCSGASKIFMGGTSSKLQALSLGSFAQGAVVSAMSGEASIKSSSYGSFAQGYSFSTSGLKTIEATHKGAFAHGYTLTGSIIASGQNSMAVGDNITASASNSIVFGLSCVNATANSMRIGWSANGGVHVKNQELWFGDADALFTLDIGATNGLQIGKSASQKLSFFGATPVTQRLKANYNNWANHSDIVNALVDLGLFDQT